MADLLNQFPELRNKSNEQLRALYNEQVGRMGNLRPAILQSAQSKRAYEDAAMLKRTIGTILHTRGQNIMGGERRSVGTNAQRITIDQGIAPDTFDQLRLSTAQRAFIIKASAHQGVDPMTWVRAQIERIMREQNG